MNLKLNVMEEIYESKYMKLYYSAENSVIEEVWNNNSSKMSVEEFKEEIRTTLKMMKSKNAKRYLVNSKEFCFAITPDLQEWMHQSFIIPFVGMGVSKAGFVMTNEMIAQLSIEQTTDEDKENRFQREFFTTREEAFRWMVN